MGMECGECERDLRAGHAPECSRYVALVCPRCFGWLEEGDGDLWCATHGDVEPEQLTFKELQANRAAIREGGTDDFV